MDISIRSLQSILVQVKFLEITSRSSIPFTVTKVVINGEKELSYFTPIVGPAKQVLPKKLTIGESVALSVPADYPKRVIFVSVTTDRGTKEAEFNSVDE